MRSIPRRDFLKALAATAAGSVLSRTLIADDKPSSVQSPRASKPDLWVVKGTYPARMLNEGISKAGGWDNLVRKGAKVILKPNAAWAAKPEDGANTRPELVAAFAKGAFAAGAAEVIVCENTCSPESQSFEMSGIGPAIREAGGKIYRPKDASHFRRVEIPNGKSLKEVDVAIDVMECDCLVNMPVAKHHGGAMLTVTMKNWMGSVKDRGQWHRSNLHQCIADFSSFLKATLNIVDATRVLTTNGPRGPGKLIYPNLIIIGRDPVACDAYAATLLGKEPFNIPYIRIAHEMGIGQGDLSKVNVITLEV